MSAEDNLEISASIKQRGHQDIDSVLKLVNLAERRSSKFSTFSLGMKQRLAIAAALLGNPDILVLDEPTNGLDPVGIAEIRELILQLNQHGITIIIASHLLDEVEKVCTHVAILKTGTLITEGPVHEVLSDEEWIEVYAEDKARLMEFIKHFPGVKSYRDQKNIQISLHKHVRVEDFNKACFEQGITLNHISKHKRSLESKFMEITK